MLTEDYWQIGVDLIDHDKFARFDIYNYTHFYNRVYSQVERNYCQNQIKRFAGIFAAKEAIYKAVATFGETYISQYEIDHDLEGQPLIKDRKFADTPINHLNIDNQMISVKVSISHSQSQSVAFALARKRVE